MFLDHCFPLEINRINNPVICFKIKRFHQLAFDLLQIGFKILPLLFSLTDIML